MAIVSSRKAIHLKDIDRLNQKRTQILDNVCIFKYSDSDKILSKRSSVVLQALNCRAFVVSVDDAASLVQGYVTGQIWFQVNFDLTKVDSQFPLFPSTNSWIIRAKRQRK